MRIVPEGSLVTTENGAPVCLTARSIERGYRLSADLFGNWRIPPIQDGERAGAFLGPDGRPFLGCFPVKDRFPHRFVSLIHIDGVGWWPKGYRP